MVLTQLSTPLTRAQAFALVDAVMDREGLAISAAAHESANGEWMFEATCDSEPDVAAFETLAAKILGGTVTFDAAVLPETDWVAKSLEGLKPVTAAGFYIYGSHHASLPPAGLTAIRIDAAEAFGTGHHATTTLCLEALAAVLRRRRPRHVLDLGCDTGILAIAAAKRLRRPVLATDIDPKAVAATVENARINGVGHWVVAARADGLNHPAIAENAPFDLILANILAGPLCKLAPAMARRAAPGATIVVSGLLETQAARVVAAYADNDMVLNKKAARDGWAALILRKKRRTGPSGPGPG